MNVSWIDLKIPPDENSKQDHHKCIFQKISKEIFEFTENEYLHEYVTSYKFICKHPNSGHPQEWG